MHFMTQNEILKMPAFGISTFDVTFQSEKWDFKNAGFWYQHI